MKSEKKNLLAIMAITAVFSFSFSFFCINPSLHHHLQQISWHSNYLFTEYYASFPGGPAEHLSLFLSQFFYNNTAGSLIITLAAFFISYFLYKSLILTSKKNNILYLSIPIIQIIALALFCDYRYYFSSTLNLLIVSWLLYICAFINNKAKLNISFHTFIAGVLIYYISGGAYFLIFMLSSLLILSKNLNGKIIINASLIIIAGLLLPFIAHNFLSHSSLYISYFRSTPDVAVMLRYSNPPLFIMSLAIIPLVILLVRLLSIIPLPEIKAHKKQATKNKSVSLSLLLKNRKNSLIIQIISLMIFSFFLLKYTYDPGEKLKAEIDYYAHKQDWSQVVSLTEKSESYDRMINFQFNRALSHSGQLLEKLFHYEQLLGSQGLFLDKPFTAEVALPNSDLYFDLGNIDESQRLALESQTLMAYSPRVLKRLIKNCIILNKTEGARTYINILSTNPMEKEWVNKYTPFVKDPELAAADKIFKEKRKDMSKTEGLYVTPRNKLIGLLQKNPLNKKAFEYLIAFDLMEHNMVALINDMEFITGLNYKKLPTVLEEAIILFRSQRPDNEFLRKLPISKSTVERFKKFASLTSANRGNREKAKLATAEFKKTYWYYVLFQSPLVTKLKLTTKPVKKNY